MFLHSPRRAVPPPAPFDDRATSAAIAALAAAFCAGGLLALWGLKAASARVPPAGPADGAPLMRAPLQVVAPVDLKRYAGLWYEQASLPSRFQKPCQGTVTAEYTPQDDGSLRVLNRCIRPDGEPEEATGLARVVPVAGQPGAGRLALCFAPAWLAWLPLVWTDYWIIKLDRDYQVALVGTPDREQLWLLSRVPQLNAAALDAELEYARTLGFDVDKVMRTGAPAPTDELA